MNTKTKRSVTHDDLKEMIESANLGEITNTQELTGGEYNTAWHVVTSKGDYLIKIAPSQAVETLTYENNLIEIEVAVYGLLAKLKGVHIPQIYAQNVSPDDEIQYFIMEFLDAQPMKEVKLSADDKKRLLYDLGSAVAQIHKIKGHDGFGYSQNGLKPSWREAYESMIQNILSDAHKKNAKIPKENEIMQLIEKYGDILDEVEVPTLVHFDVWAGNIFLKDRKLYSLIDTERAMWGDYYGDFISFDYVHDLDDKCNKPFVDGYNEAADEKIEFTKSTVIRMNLIRIYLGMIMFTEVDYRLPKYSVNYFVRRAFAKWFINKSIKKIKAADAEE